MSAYFLAGLRCKCQTQLDSCATSRPCGTFGLVQNDEQQPDPLRGWDDVDVDTRSITMSSEAWTRLEAIETITGIKHGLVPDSGAVIEGLVTSAPIDSALVEASAFQAVVAGLRTGR